MTEEYGRRSGRVLILTAAAVLVLYLWWIQRLFR